MPLKQVPLKQVVDEPGRFRPMKIKLYHYPLTRSARVKWLLHELVGEDFTVEVVQLYEGRQYQPDYLRLNPNHNVPMLEISLPGGESMHMLESVAMIAWLADAFPEKQLAPLADRVSLQRADYLQMLYFGAASMDMMLWQIRIHEHVLPMAQRDERTSSRYRRKFTNEVEPQLAARLSRSGFICGDSFSAADCVIAHTVLWARAYGLCHDEVFTPYVSRMMDRPAWQAAFADGKGFQLEVPAGSVAAESFTG